MSPLLDLEHEHLGVGPILVRLPGLPLHLWLEDVFKRNGNALGTYLDYGKSYIVTSNMAMACILVHLGTREGIEDNLHIH